MGPLRSGFADEEGATGDIGLVMNVKARERGGAVINFAYVLCPMLCINFSLSKHIIFMKKKSWLMNFHRSIRLLKLNLVFNFFFFFFFVTILSNLDEHVKLNRFQKVRVCKGEFQFIVILFGFPIFWVFN